MNHLFSSRKLFGHPALYIILSFLFFCCVTARADEITRWLKQTVYVPLYSHIYADEQYRDKPFNLSATLSIRNTDPQHSLILKKVDYYDSNGGLLKKYLASPLTIGPLASIRYIVRESESKGGSGAKFIVAWTASSPVVEPIIESIMIGTKLRQGISFLCQGKVIAGEKAR
jgi:hypothetical protein